MDCLKRRCFGGILVATTLASAVTPADFSYPVQEFRFGIGNSNRSITAAIENGTSYLGSATFKGNSTQKWFLNYVSKGVFEIASSETGDLVTSKAGQAVLEADKDGTDQRWQIKAVEKDFEGYDLYYKVVSNADTNQALTFNPTNNSIKVEAYKADEYQKFKLNLDGLEGYAANAQVGGKQKAGTIGGLLGETVVVTTNADLIAALDKTEPLTVVVNADLDLVNQNKAKQRIRDNKTLVGSFNKNTIYDSQFRNDDFYGADAAPSNNIVIRNLNLVGRYLNSDGSGMLLLYIYGGRNIWIDHNNFSATFDQNKDKEVGKFIWINTPSNGWSDDKYNGVNPDYITISYNFFKNRFWTVAFGSQNKDTSRLRTTLMYNKWEQCSRRTPQYSNGFHHNFGDYHTVTGSSNPNASSQIIGGEGSRILSENNRFEAYTGKEFDIDKNSALGFYDYNSYTSSTVGGTPSKINKAGSGVSWKASDSYGYHLVDGYNANGKDVKSFTNAYSGCFKKAADFKFVTDESLSSYVSKTVEDPFLKTVEVGNAPVFIKIEPMNGELIENLMVDDTTYYAGWSIEKDAKVGSKIYGDRDFTYTALPETLAGAEAILTACDSKKTDKQLAKFTAAKNIDIYVGLDSRVTTAAEWLMDWKQTDMTVTSSNDATYKLYKRSVKAGEEVVLGTNGQTSGCLNYIVLVTEHQEDILPPPEDTKDTTDISKDSSAIDTKDSTESAKGESAKDSSVIDAINNSQDTSDSTGIDFIHETNTNSMWKVSIAGSSLIVSTSKTSSVTLYNISGKAIHQFTANPGTTELNLTNMAKGIYFVKILQDSYLRVIKVNK